MTTPSEAGRVLRALRRSDVPGICARCGAPFQRISGARFCKRAHGQRQHIEDYERRCALAGKPTWKGARPSRLPKRTPRPPRASAE